MGNLKTFIKGYSLRYFLLYLLLGFILSIFIKDGIFLSCILDIIMITAMIPVYVNNIRNFNIRDVISLRGAFYLSFLLAVVFMGTQGFAVMFSKYFMDPGFDRMQDTIVKSSPWLYMILTVFLAPIFEELLMRGLLYTEMKRAGLSVISSAFLSSFIFAVFHGTLIHIITATFVGMFLSCLYESTGDLKYPVIFHMLYNTAVFSSVMLKISYPYFFFTPFVSVLLMTAGLTGSVFMGDILKIFKKEEDADSQRNIL